MQDSRKKRVTPKSNAAANESIASKAFSRLTALEARYILVPVLAILVLLTGVMTWITLSRISEIEHRDLQQTLENILLITEESIYNWYLARKAYIETRTTSFQLRDYTKSLLAERQKRVAKLDNPTDPKARDLVDESPVTDPTLLRVRDLFNESLLMHGYLDFFIISPDYFVLAAMQDNLIGKPIPLIFKKNYLPKVLRGHFQLTHPINASKLFPIQIDASKHPQPTMFLCAPIKDETDAVIAALALQVDPSHDFSQIVHIGRFGKTGDTYAFDRNANLLTQSRFDSSLQAVGLLKPGQHSVLSITLHDPGGDLRNGFQPRTPKSEWPLTQMVLQAVAGRHGTDLNGYRDYRGATVVGTWTWMNELDMGLATEIERADAFRSLNSTRIVVLSSLGIIVSMFLVFTILLVQSNKKIRRIAHELENANQQLNQSHQKLAEQHDQLKRTQAQLVHSEKMAGLGTLVAGVAHEINNPTNFVGSCAQDMEGRLKAFQEFILNLLGENQDPSTVQMFKDRFDPLFKNLCAVKEGNQRIQQIVSELKIFSQLDESAMKPNKLLTGLHSTINLVETQYRNHINIITDFQVDPIVNCRPAQLNQVFMNIMINAFQTISNKQKRSDADYTGELHISTFIQDNWLAVRFKDNGEGISEKFRHKLFEPFFTTKAVGEGTGLGLSISFGIVEDHGGRIEVDSAVGQGTTFTVLLPINEQKV